MKILATKTSQQLLAGSKIFRVIIICNSDLIKLHDWMLGFSNFLKKPALFLNVNLLSLREISINYCIKDIESDSVFKYYSVTLTQN